MYKKILSVIISIIIILFFILFLLNKDNTYSQIENRYLNTMPKFSFDKMLNGRYTKDIEKYTEDQFPFRNTFIIIKALSDKLVLKRKIDDVYIGKNNYLIKEFKEPQNTSKIVNVLNNFDYKLHSNINLYLMLVPTSVTINKDSLPSFAYNASELDMIDNIYSNINFNYIDIYETLNHNNYYNNMFYHLDHHWTSFGAYYAYLEYLNKLGLKNNVNINNIIEITDSFYGSLHSKTLDITKLPDSIYIYNSKSKITVKYIDTNVTSDSLYNFDYLEKKDKYSLFLDNNHSLITIINNSINNQNELLIIKDSFANSMIPYLIENYKKIHVIDLRYYNESVSEYIGNNTNINDVLILYNANTIDTDTGIMMLE